MMNDGTDDKTLDNVIRFPVEAVTRFGYKRAEKRGANRSEKMELEGQMTLFEGEESRPAPGKVVPLPLQMSPFEEALLLDEQGDDRAEEIYVKAIEDGDRIQDAWCNLGVLKTIEGDLDSAFDCFAQSLAIAPRHAESHYNIANLYFEIGDLRLARTHYEIALCVVQLRAGHRPVRRLRNRLRGAHPLQATRPRRRGRESGRRTPRLHTHRDQPLLIFLTFRVR
jgi:tetratricopeptide (TPR) repeat protein